MPRSASDLTGRKIGKLIVISLLNKTGKQVWLCKCVCGVMKKVHRGNLTSKRSPTRSCGSDICRRELVNLLGNTYGKLTVVGLHKRCKHTLWDCKCTCGKITVVTTSALVAGSTKSCGARKCKIRFNDLTGKRVGKLVVNTMCKNTKGQTYWNCTCDCGNKIVRSGNSLVSRSTRNQGCSLGCANRKGTATIENTAFLGQKGNARTRSYSWFLSKIEYLSIVSNPCTYCGEFSTRKNPNTQETMLLNSCDRVNNEPFYKVSNCQSVCFTCQTMKMAMKDEDFKNQIKKLALRFTA